MLLEGFWKVLNEEEFASEMQVNELLVYIYVKCVATFPKVQMACLAIVARLSLFIDYNKI